MSAFHPAQVPTALYRASEVSWVNAGFSAVMLVLILVILIRYNHMFNLVERIGHGIAGMASFLSIFKQLGFAALMVPFNDLYQLGWRVGWIFLLGGKVWRMEQHSRNNKQAVRDAKAWRSAREQP